MSIPVPDLSQLAQGAIDLLKPELLLAAQKGAEALATEGGKQVLEWFRTKLAKRPLAKAAFEDAGLQPTSELRYQALLTQLQILLEEDPAFRKELADYVATIQVITIPKPWQFTVTTTRPLK